jgi:uncharacterized membrane protein YgdD (TMEM256/DUF423 family)
VKKDQESTHLAEDDTSPATEPVEKFKPASRLRLLLLLGVGVILGMSATHLSHSHTSFQLAGSGTLLLFAGLALIPASLKSKRNRHNILTCGGMLFALGAALLLSSLTAS